MNGFDYSVATDVDALLQQMAAPGAAAVDASKLIAGGTNLLDLMKENLVRPRQIVDLNRLPPQAIERLPDGAFRLGALARNAATAYHPELREQLPLLSTAILAGASAQIRNMASNGGNLMQRTRCHYFYDAGVPCNKRAPGTGCPALDGLARQHAIVGASDHCIATHPSDMCVALAALEAVVHVRSVRGARQIAFADFHRLPGDQPELDNTLAPDELIEAIVVPPSQHYAAHSAYLKLRERLSYAFALVSVAAALDLDADGRIRSARIALGGVAHKPWRDPSAEALLVGAPATTASFDRAAAQLLQGAQAQGVGPGSNAFKIPMARRAVVRALATAALGTVTNTGDNLP
ncbi:xanthine dehydrogenase family protein subunit M [Pseudorhodoferax sp. Leaf267]|uniref:FAD binding domain-containing protein n=1 Tax=Pseudorhodoferax sp. Leaf267 TaxID=1736316 RepID=UPI0006FB9655|nr:xanthine dehydrogenase family protein subunit M [Pseudorhodoferax sp. Leaf267]KQP22958.1 FAD-binding molybdopterin dehydrogenase [Pseudorhodoferax sp. Leaf267]